MHTAQLLVKIDMEINSRRFTVRTGCVVILLCDCSQSDLKSSVQWRPQDSNWGGVYMQDCTQNVREKFKPRPFQARFLAQN